MLKQSELKLDNSIFKDSFLLTDITHSYQYQNGKRTETISSYNHQVLLPLLKFEKINVKLERPLMKAEDIPDGGVKVGFEGLVATPYIQNNNIIISAKTDKIMVQK